MIVNAPKREKIEHERKDNGLDKCKQTRMHRYVSEWVCLWTSASVCVWISAMCIINAGRCFPYRVCECVRGEEGRHRRDQSGANIEIHTAAPHRVYSNRHFLLSDTATHIYWVNIIEYYYYFFLNFICCCCSFFTLFNVPWLMALSFVVS